MKTSRQNDMSFTLVEMIVAMGVLSILTFLLFSVLNETSRAILMSSGRTRVYTDLRVVVDQLSRDLQQSVDDNRYNCFRGFTSELHFVATIDNNTGNEEAEVGYFWSNNFTLCKSVQFSQKKSSNNALWDIGAAQTNGPSYDWWSLPKLGDSSNYVAILENVRSVRFTYLDTNFNPVVGSNWLFSSQGNQLPAYIQTVFGVCDPQDVVRYQGVSAVDSKLVRYFTNQVYLPRQQ